MWQSLTDCASNAHAFHEISRTGRQKHAMLSASLIHCGAICALVFGVLARLCYRPRKRVVWHFRCGRLHWEMP
jgi:hypothetical protein